MHIKGDHLIMLQSTMFDVLTGQDRLVNTKGGGTDCSNPDVSGDFITNWGRGKRV